MTEIVFLPPKNPQNVKLQWYTEMHHKNLISTYIHGLDIHFSFNSLINRNLNLFPKVWNVHALLISGHNCLPLRKLIDSRGMACCQ